jgi:hypothetical protein
MQIPEVVRPSESKTDLPLHSGIGFEALLASIGDHPGGDGFHEPIIRAIASYVSSNGRSKTDVRVLFEIIRERILSADRSAHTQEYVELMANEHHIMPAIAGALEKYGDDSTPRRKSRVIEGGNPLPPRVFLPAAEAHRALTSALEVIIVPGKP